MLFCRLVLKLRWNDFGTDQRVYRLQRKVPGCLGVPGVKGHNIFYWGFELIRIPNHLNPYFFQVAHRIDAWFFTADVGRRSHSPKGHPWIPGDYRCVFHWCQPRHFTDVGVSEDKYNKIQWKAKRTINFIGTSIKINDRSTSLFLQWKSLSRATSHTIYTTYSDRVSRDITENDVLAPFHGFSMRKHAMLDYNFDHYQEK